MNYYFIFKLYFTSSLVGTLAASKALITNSKIPPKYLEIYPPQEIKISLKTQKQ